MGFVNEYIPKDARVHLVGHSIGAWMILKLLEDEVFAGRVVKCYLLFPTIEHMADTHSGKFFSNIVSIKDVFRILSTEMFSSMVISFQVMIKL